jgi:hypothetical protein
MSDKKRHFLFRTNTESAGFNNKKYEEGKNYFQLQSNRIKVWRQTPDKFFVSGCPLNETYSMTACLYEGYVFVAMFNRQNQKLVFTDYENEFSQADIDTFRILFDRIDKQFAGQDLTYGKKTTAAWQKVLPLLQAVILYERYLENYNSRLKDSQEYDEALDALVTAYETSGWKCSMEGLYLAVNGKVPSLDTTLEAPYTAGSAGTRKRRTR